MENLLKLISEKQEFGAVIDKETITLTRNGFACVCPIQNRVILPSQNRVQGGAAMQVTPAICNSNCPFFTLYDYAPSENDRIQNFNWVCETQKQHRFIKPENVTTAPDPENKLSLI